MAGGDMLRSQENIPHSSKYTSATWTWAGLPYADIVVPDGAQRLFDVVNFYMRLYRIVNPRKYSLHHTLLHRHTMINYLLENAGAEQVVELASGFSPRGAYISDEKKLSYYEVDMPDVIALKKSILQRSQSGRGVLNRNNFVLQGGDILHIDIGKRFPAKKTFFITEGLMMYFVREEQLKIWKSIAAHIKKNAGKYVFDYIPLDIEPSRSALGKGLHWFKKTFIGGDKQGYCYDERTRFDVRDDLLLAGFNQVNIYESHEYSKRWDLPFSDVATRVAVFECL